MKVSGKKINIKDHIPNWIGDKKWSLLWPWSKLHKKTQRSSTTKKLTYQKIDEEAKWIIQCVWTQQLSSPRRDVLCPLALLLFQLSPVDCVCREGHSLRPWHTWQDCQCRDAGCHGQHHPLVRVPLTSQIHVVCSQTIYFLVSYEDWNKKEREKRCRFEIIVSEGRIGTRVSRIDLICNMDKKNLSRSLKRTFSEIGKRDKERNLSSLDFPLNKGNIVVTKPINARKK